MTETGATIDTGGVLADGSKVDGPIALRNAILSRPEAFATVLTERMMTYALGPRRRAVGHARRSQHREEVGTQ